MRMHPESDASKAYFATMRGQYIVKQEEQMQEEAIATSDALIGGGEDEIGDVVNVLSAGDGTNDDDDDDAEDDLEESPDNRQYYDDNGLYVVGGFVPNKDFCALRLGGRTCTQQNKRYCCSAAQEGCCSHRRAFYCCGAHPRRYPTRGQHRFSTSVHSNIARCPPEQQSGGQSDHNNVQVVSFNDATITTS